jgi:2-alkenal reductase
MRTFGKKSVTVVIALLIAVLAFYVGTATISSSAQEAVSWPAKTPSVANVNNAVLDSERAYANIYNSVGPSVVSINVVATQSSGNNGFNGSGDQLVQGTGTGFVIDTQGHIVTNNHVVDGATRIEVNFFDGSIYRGEIIGVDPDSDLAVIQVNRAAGELHPVTLGDSSQAFIGQEVVALGSPFDEPWTLTTGVISALDRQIDSLGQFTIGSVIQTDAAINPGNSGGPLVNLKGEVIGVNSQILSRSGSGSGIGFAIPSNLVKRVSQALIQDGRVTYSYLGISGTDMSLYMIEAMGLPNNARGVVVNQVTAGGPAAQAGLRNAGNPRTVDGAQVPTSADIITAVNGTPVTSMESLISYLGINTMPGDTVTLTVVRDGSQQIQLPVTLSGRPSST